MANLSAVVGVGQIRSRTKHADKSIAGMVRVAADRALEDAGVTWNDIEAVIIGKAPDFFEGVLQPELYLAEALGAVGKPMLRVHTAGSVGGSTGVVAASYVQSGAFKRVLVLCFEKQSEGNAMWALSPKMPFSPHINAGAGGYFAPAMRLYIEKYHADPDTGYMVAVKDRLNALKNPYAHLTIEDISIEMVKESPMLWEPIRYLESCPSSDGACAMVIVDESLVKDSPNKPAWILGTSVRSEPTMYAHRDTVSPPSIRDCAKDVYRQAGITNPRREIDMAELYVPFSWYEPMWLEATGLAEQGEGWKMTMEGITAIDGDMPVNCSGGVISSNPIGASGLIRFAEAALQVRAMAGEHQIEGAKTAIGHAMGGGAQFFAMWAVGAEKP
ncbi:MAG: thiolase domain-containing protein [Deltaproteobacteria bacterium]|nr:thiolase domain-containing protein [Deltaproteobacteria bacterium]